MVIEFLLCFFTALLLVVFFNQKPKKLPPGEWGLPLVGFMPFVEKRFSKTAEKLHRKYGDIFHIKIGSRLFVIVAGFPKIKELFNKPELADRSFLYTHHLYNGKGELGIITSNGTIWNTNRRFALRTLKDFGMGKSKIEDSILAEAEELIRNFEKMVDRPVKIDWTLNVAILNVIWRLVANQRYDIDDKEIKQFSQYSSENVEDIEGPMILFDYFPWLESLVPDFIKRSWMRVGAVERKRELILQFILDIVNEHKKTIERSDPRDLIDKYLIEMENQEGNPLYSHMGDDDLVVTVLNLFGAGSETTASTIRWFFAYMAKYVHIQKMIQKQIDSAVPRSRLPTIDDKKNLPYVEALVHELSRKISFLPTSLPHEASEDIPVGDYIIPKGATVLPYLEQCHFDPNYWERPNEFHLDHFLDDEGRFVQRKDAFVPFSIGKRLCPGEAMAKMELYIFIGAVLQNFEICEPADQTISLEPDDNVSLVNYCSDFEIILKKRK